MKRKLVLPAMMLVLSFCLSAADTPKGLLFSFEDSKAASSWKSMKNKLNDPGVNIKFVKENATQGDYSMKLTFSGGHIPGVETDVMEYNEFDIGDVAIFADIFAPRDCAVILEVDDGANICDKACRLYAGKNKVFDYFKMPEKPKFFRIMMVDPKNGESIYIDNIRIKNKKVNPGTATPFSEQVYNNFWFAAVSKPMKKSEKPYKMAASGVEFYTAGEAMSAAGDSVLYSKAKDAKEAEEEFSKLYGDLKTKNPEAVMKVFREGENGFKGWSDTYFNCHPPTSGYLAPVKDNSFCGKNEQVEGFMRHRNPIFRVDLSKIPANSEILAAWFLYMKTDTTASSGFVVAQACARDWVEDELNVLQYAKGKYWKEVNGIYEGDDPDFPQVILGAGATNTNRPIVVNFTEGVKWWVEGKNPNCGFVICNVNGAGDYFQVCTKEAKDVKSRPAMMVIYKAK